jgi:archaellum component FlaG (FlaF/FlaG flagellin family)
LALRTYFFKDRRALSPIVLSALLIVVLIGFASVVIIWFSLQQKAGNAIYVQSVNFGDSNLMVYVQNIGDGSVVLDSVFIDNNRFDVTLENCVVANQPATEVEKGQTATVTINNLYQQEIHIRAVCKDGTSTESNWDPMV